MEGQDDYPPAEQEARPTPVKTVVRTGLLRRTTVRTTFTSPFSRLPDEEQDRVLRDWKNGKITDEELDRLFQTNYDFAAHEAADEMVGGARSMGDVLDGLEAGADQTLADAAERLEVTVLPDGSTNYHWPEDIMQARKIKFVVGEIRSAIASGDASKAAFETYRITTKIFHDILDSIEHTYNSGVKQRERARKGGRATRRRTKEKHAHWMHLARQIWQSRPDLSMTAVASAISTRCSETCHAGPVNTIRRVIRFAQPVPQKPGSELSS